MDSRLIAISNLLAQYSMGNFNAEEVALSKNLDEIDSIIGGVNMLGEELEATTVSRDFFARIYNTVSNFLIVTDTDWKIKDINRSVVRFLGYKENQLLSMHVDSLIVSDDIESTKRKLLNTVDKVNNEVNFIRKDGTIIPTDCTWSRLYSLDGEVNGYLIVADDLTDKKLKEREILISIMETQEQERIRVADDLHDSLGQELCVIRMMLEVTTTKLGQGKEKSNLIACANLLDASLDNIRSICFDLVPKALNEGELISALRLLIRKLKSQGVINYVLETSLGTTELSQQRQIAVYRVIQEFIHNTVKHARCSMIKIEINEQENMFVLSIMDNGVGFDMKNGNEFSGRGLSTMKSRIQAMNGTINYYSELGKGTNATIEFQL